MDIDDLFQCFDEVPKLEIEKDSQGVKRTRTENSDEYDSSKKNKLDKDDLEQFKQSM